MPAPSSTRRRPVRGSFLAWGLVSVCLLSACSGGDSPPTQPPPAGTLAVSLASSSGALVAGTSTTFGVNITRGGSFTGTVALTVEGAPAGVSAALTPTTVAAGSTSASLALAVANSVAAGTYTLTVRATGANVTAATTSYALTVTAAPVPAFTLAATPAALTVATGAQAASQIAITRTGGFTGAVDLTLSGAPAGVTATFAPASVTGTSSTLTIAVGASVAAGSYPLTVNATGTGVTARTAAVALTVTVTPTPTLSITSAVSAVTVTQAQQSVAIPLVLARNGGATGDITLTLEGAPAGVTGAFTPNPATGAGSQLTISVGASVAAGTYPLTVRGTAGTASGTLAIALTVTVASAGDFAISAVPSSLTVVQGETGLSTINIARTGGFTGQVNLTVTGAPAGVTATFTPAGATGTQSQLGLTVGATVTPGTYTLTVRGNATLLAERTTSLALTVQAGSTGGTGNVTWKFCDTNRFPMWFAYQDGTSGAWTRVLPGANQTYGFNINQAVGGVAFVTTDDDGTLQTTILLNTRSELTALGTAECVSSPGLKTVNGTVAGLAIGQTANIALGAASTSTFANGPFTITNAPTRATDLFAARTTLDIGTLSQLPDRFVLRRNVNPAAGSTMPVVDFAGAEAFAPATATYTLANATGHTVLLTTGFSTSRGAAGFFAFGPLSSTAAVRTAYGVPLARTETGDLHQVLATAISGTSTRVVAQYNRELIDRTLTFGPLLGTPTVTPVPSSPYVRLRATGTFQSDYGDAVGISYIQSTSPGLAWVITASRGYTSNSATYDLVLPDFSGVTGFNITWALKSGTSTMWTISASHVEGGSISSVSEGFLMRSGSQTGTITP